MNGTEHKNFTHTVDGQFDVIKYFNQNYISPGIKIVGNSDYWSLDSWSSTLPPLQVTNTINSVFSTAICLPPQSVLQCNLCILMACHSQQIIE